MRVNGKIKAIANDGYPTSVTEMERMYYSPVKPDENAAVFFTEAFAHIPVSKSRKLIVQPWPSINSRSNAAFLAPTNKTQVADILHENADLLAILRKAPRGEKSRYPMDFNLGTSIPLPHLQQIKASMSPLLLDAAVQAQEGRPEQATEDMQAALRLSGSLREEPLVISQLVRISCREMINSALERVLSEQRLTDNQILALIRSVDDEENPNSMEHAMAGERCLGIHYHQHPVEESLAATRTPSPDDDSPSPTADKLAPGFALFRVVGLLAADLDYYLGIMSQRVALTKAAFPERIAAANRLDDQLSHTPWRYYHLYADLVLPALNKVDNKCARDVARLGLRRTALAIERYRLSNQDHLPGKLIDLVPAFLSSVPQDPFDGQPLRFKPLDKGYVIYSVGPDLTDDGGREWQRRPKGATNDLPYDITFIVER